MCRIVTLCSTRPTLQYPELPEAVMDKLLALEANELDMLLQYPRATQVTVRPRCRPRAPPVVRWARGHTVHGKLPALRCHRCTGRGIVTQLRPSAAVSALSGGWSRPRLVAAHSAMLPAGGSPFPPFRLQVERLMLVFKENGPEKLEDYEVPLLSWDDYQAIKEQALALPAGDSTAAASDGRLLEGAERGAAGGEAQARAVEAHSAAVQLAPPAGPRPAAGAAQAQEGAGLAAGDEDGGLDDGASEAGSIDVDDVDELFELD